jgi:crotonobetainyl-CoA:carnitine CoA-transferase CaiB-like acyl-CoA transferase
MQFSNFAEFLSGGRVPYKLGRSYGEPPFGPIRAKDGDVLTIFGIGPTWPAFCKVAGLDELAGDPRFKTQEDRHKNREELGRILDERFSTKTRSEWEQIFREGKMRCDPCLTYQEIARHPQFQANNAFCSISHPERGVVKMLNVPVRLKKTPARPQGPSPGLGQHTEEILRGLGYTTSDIADLEANKVVKTAGSNSETKLRGQT